MRRDRRALRQPMKFGDYLETVVDDDVLRREW
jgi:hypothetical protein